MEKLPPWEALLKNMIWKQLGTVTDKQILDFGSGSGATAAYYAKKNDVTAMEPYEDQIDGEWREKGYTQIIGSTERLRFFKEGSFDLILCHNVLEYAADRENIIREFYRLLKPDGFLSIVKHNPPGRVMQMAVLLNDFQSAEAILDGADGVSQKFGTIHYYNDEDISGWCKGFSISRAFGIRTFWDLQQNQEIQKDPEWQKNMLQLEMRVSEMEEYRNIAFFHHLIITKR